MHRSINLALICLQIPSRFRANLVVGYFRVSSEMKMMPTYLLDKSWKKVGRGCPNEIDQWIVSSWEADSVVCGERKQNYSILCIQRSCGISASITWDKGWLFGVKKLSSRNFWCGVLHSTSKFEREWIHHGNFHRTEHSACTNIWSFYVVSSTWLCWTFRMLKTNEEVFTVPNFPYATTLVASINGTPHSE